MTQPNPCSELVRPLAVLLSPLLLFVFIAYKTLGEYFSSLSEMHFSIAEEIKVKIAMQRLIYKTE